jgi:hypothetical protein
VASGAGLRILATNAGSGPQAYSGAITLNNNLRLQNQSANRVMTVSGGITGTGNVTIYSNNTNGATAGIVLGGQPINNIGTVSNISPGNAPLTQSSGGVIGSNVTSFIQNSATSTTTLSLANSYGTTSILAGTLVTTGTGTLGTGNVTVNGGLLTLGSSISLSDTAILSFINSGTATITLNNVTSDIVGGITDLTSSISVGSGVWTASALNTAFGTNVFAGAGTLTITAIPEPSTLAMSLFTLGMVALARFRRRS